MSKELYIYWKKNLKQQHLTVVDQEMVVINDQKIIIYMRFWNKSKK